MGIPPSTAIHLRPISFLGLGMCVTSEPQTHVSLDADGAAVEDGEMLFIDGVLLLPPYSLKV